MELIKKTFKLLVFGIVLVFLSAGYRLLGDKNNKNNNTEGKNLINSAKADAPPAGGGSIGGACEGTGPAGGGSDGGSGGDG